MVVTPDSPVPAIAHDATEIQGLLNEVLDHGLLFHGFTPYMRDYELVITASSDPRLGRPTEYLSYLFVNCVRVETGSTLGIADWLKSLSEELLEPNPDTTYDAFVWGVNWQPLWPVFELVVQSAPAAQWSRDLGRPFHQLTLESNAHKIDLIFSELRVTKVDVGYTPFRIKPEA